MAAKCSLAAVLVGFVGIGAACRRGAESRQAAAPRRDVNVLLVTLDTTRADHLSCYAEVASRVALKVGATSPLPASLKAGATTEASLRQPRRGKRGARTPHLDALSARGVLFAQAMAQVPLTLPSHASVFTGTYPNVHQLRDMGGFVLDARHLTLATLLRRVGFRTAAFVGSKAVSRHFGLNQGFEVYDDQMSPLDLEGKLPGVFPERRANVPTDHAIEWLRQHKQGKFFLWVHYYDPHDPYDPPEPYKSAYPEDPYSGEVAYMDEQFGRLMGFLNQEGLQEKTLVIAIGDHGEGLNDHGEMTHGIFLYDETLRVPLLLAGPEVPAGKVIATQVRSIDLLPTLLDYLGLPPHPAGQGISLWPLVRQGRPTIGKNAGYAYIETLYPKTYMNWSELRGVRTDRWKFILAPRPELYDLERDPDEKENVISRYPAEADHLQKKIWEVIGPPTQDQKLTYVPVDHETRQELESLGYVSGGSPRELTLNMSGSDPKNQRPILAAMQQYERHMKRRAYAQAVQVTEVALRTDPSNPTLRMLLANAYEKQRQWRRAIEVYRGAVEAGGATDLMLMRLGKAYLRAGDLRNGVEVMQKAASADPTELDNLRNLGIACLELGRVHDAERAFRAILVQDERYAAAYNGLGLVAVRRGDAEGARQSFEKAIEVNPDEVEPMLNLGLLYDKAGNRNLALRYYHMFLEKAPREHYGELFPKVREAIRELKRGDLTTSAPGGVASTITGTR